LECKVAKIIFTKQAEKSFSKLKPSDKEKISRAVEKLSKNPLAGERLRGEFEGQYKLRAWPYSIIYVVINTSHAVIIVEIGHRQGVYK